MEAMEFYFSRCSISSKSLCRPLAFLALIKSCSAMVFTKHFFRFQIVPLAQKFLRKLDLLPLS